MNDDKVVVEQPDKIKPCPFCGSRDIDLRKRKTVIIECKNCSALFINMTTAGAIEAWNMRTPNSTHTSEPKPNTDI